MGAALEVTNAYNMLASRRSFGLSPHPIQLSEILAYVQIFGLPSIDMTMFVDLIGMVDIKFLELQSGNLG